MAYFNNTNFRPFITQNGKFSYSGANLSKKGMFSLFSNKEEEWINLPEGLKFWK